MPHIRFIRENRDNGRVSDDESSGVDNGSGAIN
jgi:hypothetical protein